MSEHELDWRWQLRSQIQSPQALLAWLQKKEAFANIHPKLWKAMKNWEASHATWQQNFRFAVTPYYLGLADWQNPNCPIIAQILPSPQERIDHSYLAWDPLAEESFMPVKGLSHRYPDRALWYLTHLCAVYCRFCTRKRKVSHASSAPKRSEWEDVLRYLREHKEIKEVILSGGDPLALSNENVAYILEALGRIRHLYSIRIHSRMPVTLPMRIDKGLAEIFAKAYPLTLVSHFNHACEVTDAAKESVRLLKMHGVAVLNQAVLLKGINDSAAKQEKLLLALLKIGVQPYYLHRCDEVKGSEHFRVPLKKGIEILQSLRGRNPGIALPRYMADLPGGGGKVPLEANYLQHEESRRKGPKQETLYYVQNWEGKTFVLCEQNRKRKRKPCASLGAEQSLF